MSTITKIEECIADRMQNSCLPQMAKDSILNQSKTWEQFAGTINKYEGIYRLCKHTLDNIENGLELRMEA